MKPPEKPLAWMHGGIKSPPFSKEGRVRAGYLLRGLQQGNVLSLPDSRPMPEIGKGCHELRVPDGNVDWRIFYAVRPDAIVILGVEKKGTQHTPKATIAACARRLAAWDRE
ncbi:MAG TPA: type II toxin-antitoxin system RelE/ParE family toxin [Thermoanaerobaculia bacterium]|nr:type II toxin-antitoxin system RelE/ParE family toxin [Thermoanaerobaculia bacterium]